MEKKPVKIGTRVVGHAEFDAAGNIVATLDMNLLTEEEKNAFKLDMKHFSIDLDRSYNG